MERRGGGDGEERGRRWRGEGEEKMDLKGMSTVREKESKGEKKKEKEVEKCKG